MRLFKAIAILASLPLAVPALAAPPVKQQAQVQPVAAKRVPAKPSQLTKKDIEDIQHAQDYMNSLKSARARFVQTTHDGTQLVGTFYLQRPGKLRFEYDPPVEDFVVADGSFIYFYDAELKQQSNAPIGQTLADFILRPELRLDGDLMVRSVRHVNGLIQIEVVQRADPQAGTLILGFTENPFTLKKWRIIDPQGLITEVELFYLKSGIVHPPGLFVYAPPAQPKKYNQ